jgi:hypothetical protein
MPAGRRGQSPSSPGTEHRGHTGRSAWRQSKGHVAQGQRGLAMGVPKMASVRGGKRSGRQRRAAFKKAGNGQPRGLVSGGSKMRFFGFFAVFGGLKSGRHIIYYMYMVTNW